jgi:hypothetical protein
VDHPDQFWHGYRSWNMRAHRRYRWRHSDYQRCGYYRDFGRDIMKPIQKTIYTLNIDDYAPEICNITYPFLKFYADKIGARFCVIADRLYPNMPVVYEKLQIRELSKVNQDDWSIYFDSDALIHPETPDWTVLLNKDTVLHNGSDMAAVRWKYDQYFMRDGRNIGSCNWFTIASDWCADDLWRPLDISLDDARDNIFPIPAELNAGIDKDHLIDDYTLSRNIAKYGLKFKRAMDLQNENGMPGAHFFYHEYTIPVDEKIVHLRNTVKAWGL